MPTFLGEDDPTRSSARSGRLCVTRQIGESIRIGDDIIVTIEAVRDDGAVRVSVTAPRSIPINRSEVWWRIQQEKANEA
jgi:carbon storage regulator